MVPSFRKDFMNATESDPEMDFSLAVSPWLKDLLLTLASKFLRQMARFQLTRGVMASEKSISGPDLIFTDWLTWLEFFCTLTLFPSFQYLDVHERIGKKLTELSMRDQEMQQKMT